MVVKFGDAARVPILRCPLCARQASWLLNWYSYGCVWCHWVKERDDGAIYMPELIAEAEAARGRT